MKNDPETCGADASVAVLEQAEIHDGMTLRELRRLPVADVIRALEPDYQPATVHRFGPFGNLFFRPMRFPDIGSVISGHVHRFDHVTWLSHGALNVKARKYDRRLKEHVGEVIERQYRAPAPILIKHDWTHEFTALERGTLAACIYALRDAEGDVTDTWDGSEWAYS